MKMTKNIATFIVVYGLFLLPFIAFIVPGEMFFPFIVGKGFIFRILIEVLFGVYLILAFLDSDYRPKFSWITKSVLLFTLIILIADLFGVNVYKSIWSNYERMEGFVLIMHLALYYIVISSVLKTEARWSQFFNTSIIASVIMSLYGVLQLLGKLTINQGGTRVDATFGNATYLAIYLVFHIFLCLYMVSRQEKNNWQRWAYGGIIILHTTILYFTGTRGAILGLIGGLFLTGLLIAWKEKENKKVKKISYILTGSIIAIVLIFFTLRGTSFIKNNEVLSRFGTLSVAEFKTQGRYFVWPMAVKGVLERPLLGWGQENFNFVFNKYYDPGMIGQEEWFDRTHDVVLDWLIAGGILGFLSYVGMFVALFYYIWRRESHLKISEKSILTGMIAAYLFHNIFVFDNLISYFLFFSFLAYVHTVTAKKEVSTGKFYTRTFTDDTLNYSVAGVVLVLTLSSIYFVNVSAIKANQTLIQAIIPQKEGIEKNLSLFKQVYAYNSFGSGEATEQLVQITSQLPSTTQISDTVKQEFYNLAKTKIIEKIDSSPHDARYLVFAGSLFNRLGQYDEAIKYLEKALFESPRKQSIYVELGTSYLAKSDLKKMFEFFQKAYELAPNFLESKIIYTIGAIYTQNAEVLKKMSTELDQSVLISDNRILQAYTNIGDYNSVIEILTARVKKDPTNLQNKLTLASAYATIGQKQKAISLVREVMAVEPSFKEQGEGFIKQIQEAK